MKRLKYEFVYEENNGFACYYVKAIDEIKAGHYMTGFNLLPDAIDYLNQLIYKNVESERRLDQVK